MTIAQIAYDHTDNNLAIGKNPGFASHFDGLIDEACVYNRPFSANDVQAIANA